MGTDRLFKPGRPRLPGSHFLPKMSEPDMSMASQLSLEASQQVGDEDMNDYAPVEGEEGFGGDDAAAAAAAVPEDGAALGDVPMHDVDPYADDMGDDDIKIEEAVIESQVRVTTKYMTKYERARILGARALQISMGAPIMVQIDNETDPLVIAMKELKERKIPITIRRYMPDGSHEDWNIDELIL